MTKERIDNQRSRWALSVKRRLWTSPLNRREFIIMQDEDKLESDLMTVWIEIRDGRNKKFSLTAMTMPELQVLKEFFREAIEMAEPIVEELDRRALESFEKDGNDIHTRLYRSDPHLFRKGHPPIHKSSDGEWSESEHDQELSE